jgi:predicted lipoprotein with Yx(FWY)xxD motif
MKRAATAICWTVAALLPVTAVTGCSSSTKKAVASTSAAPGRHSVSPSSAPAVARATVGTRSVKRLGTILVDGKGRTLYLFEADKTAKSTCAGSCATAWPPLLTSGTATPAQGVKKNLLATTKRSDGTTQVVYNAHPLYYYAGDGKPGDTNGEGLNQFGAEWYALNPAGKKIDLS